MGKTKKCFDIDYKLRVLKYLKADGKDNRNQTAKHFGIDRKLISRWSKEESKLKMLKATGVTGMRPRKKYALVNSHLLKWYKGQAGFAENPPEQKVIAAKAVEIAQTVEGLGNFKCTEAWYRSWKAARDANAATAGDDGSEVEEYDEEEGSDVDGDGTEGSGDDDLVGDDQSEQQQQQQQTETAPTSSDTATATTNAATVDSPLSKVFGEASQKPVCRFLFTPKLQKPATRAATTASSSAKRTAANLPPTSGSSIARRRKRRKKAATPVAEEPAEEEPEGDALTSDPAATPDPKPVPVNLHLVPPQSQENSRLRIFACDKCEETFNTAQRLQGHIRRDHFGGKPYTCEDCSFRGRKPSDLTRHRNCVHLNQRNFPCTTCGKALKSKLALTLHHRMHTGDMPFQCQSCDKKFTSAPMLRKHVRKQHQENPEFECYKCRKFFDQEDVMKAHRKECTADSKKIFECETCGKKCRSKYLLGFHNRVHTGEKPYCCEICGKSFRFLNLLRTHQNFHLGIRPYGCEVCEKRFTTLGNLIDHRRLHTGEKPYVCEVCGKRFSANNNFNKHKRIHLPK